MEMGPRDKPTMGDKFKNWFSEKEDEWTNSCTFKAHPSEITNTPAMSSYARPLPHNALSGLIYVLSKVHLNSPGIFFI